LQLHFLKLEKVKGAKMAEKNKKDLNHEMFTNKDGYVEGGIEVEMTDPSEMQEQEVQGQGNILGEKKRKAKWY
jgi:hypothetical protein